MASLPAGRATNDASNYFAIGLQSAKDVDATTFYFLKHLDGSGFDVAVEQSSEREGGAGREVSLRYRTKVTADGQYVAYARPDYTGRVLAAALGTDTVTAGPSNPSVQLYDHFIASGGSQLYYQTIEQAWADETERVTNCLLSDVKLEGEAGKPVKLTAQFVSGGTAHTQGTLLSPTRESIIPFMVPGGSACIDFNQNLTNGVGASSLQLTKWSVEVKNTVDDNIQTVSLNREDVIWLDADYNVDGTLKYINKAAWEAIQYGGGSNVPTGNLTGGDFTFYTATPSGTSMKIFAPYIEMLSTKVNRLDPDGKTMYLDFTGATRQVGTQSLQVTVRTTASGQYTNSST